MRKIEMVDLVAQYGRLKSQIDSAVLDVIASGQYINGKHVDDFAANLAALTGARYAIPCANGTDALLLALIALDLKPGDEVIIPDFTFIAAAEVVAMLRLTPVPVDVDYKTFNIDAGKIAEAVTDRTRAVIPVHLFGQCCDMDPIIKVAKEYGLYIVEDNAQSINAVYTFPDGERRTAGTMGDIGTFSFFPSKNLGCYGDGGAVVTDNERFARKLKMLTVHGQERKYEHVIIGCNSRLDNLQAAVLNVKFTHLNDDTAARQSAAKAYTERLAGCEGFLETPYVRQESSHVFHQYTLKICNGRRDELKLRLAKQGIPSMIYYPVPVHRQPAFKNLVKQGGDLRVSEELSQSVLSLPMHPDLTAEQIDFIAAEITKQIR
ncbi:MAG: DegT/DnrJ/EryC1/StrS family aminotransferase [Dysgonamonadaceae bacterium]|jgi:dTDP-4-amino-4,6-dideoxygalactose transaminase|nr:DegT/DnrJ/EryC1/StrS family aminotransferase [Dysgonamonadaceae bacterium]